MQFKIEMKKILNTKIFFALMVVFFSSCANEDLIPIYGEQKPGKLIIKSYNAIEDSLQLRIDGKMVKIGTRDAFVKKIVKNHEFVFYNNELKNVEIIRKSTGQVLHSYSLIPTKPIDTISFYYNDGIWLEKVLSDRPGVLSMPTGRTGYRFVFPTMNRYSNSGYSGAIDAIIRKANGQVLGVAENITKDKFSNFVEFVYAPPPILNIELVKHGTTESYIPGRQVIVQVVMQNNKSKLIVLNEKSNESGVFTGVDGTINLIDYFDF